jgi:hypothetical protein
MDSKGFDRLTKNVADGLGSRRLLVGSALAGTVLAACGVWGVATTAKKKRKANGKGKGKVKDKRKNNRPLPSFQEYCLAQGNVVCGGSQCCAAEECCPPSPTIGLPATCRRRSGWVCCPEEYGGGECPIEYPYCCPAESLEQFNCSADEGSICCGGTRCSLEETKCCPAGEVIPFSLCATEQDVCCEGGGRCPVGCGCCSPDVGFGCCCRDRSWGACCPAGFPRGCCFSESDPGVACCSDTQPCSGGRSCVEGCCI